MTTDITNIISIFSKFLDSSVVKTKNLKLLEDVLKLPIYSYKFLEKSEAKVLKELLDVSNIEEASKLDKENPFERLKNIESTKDPIKAAELQEKLNEKLETLIEQNPDLEKNLKKAITISSIIANIKEEQEDIEKIAQKVVVIGLDNAGKTAILTKFGGKLGITDLASLKPTKGVVRHFIKTEESELDLFIWDMGGQLKYRNKYLENPEKYFLQLDLLIYVIDVQDSDRYAESFEYFEEVLEILNILEENPFILIYIHKYDPDLKRDPEILLNIELLKDNLNTLLNQHGFDYEAYLTSIFSLISNEPQFSKYIKDVMKSVDSLTNPTLRKVEGLGKTLEETMNAVIRLSESISRQLNELDTRLRAIESGAFQVAQSGIPIEIQNPNQQGLASRRGDSRMQVLDELKQLFEKKKKLNL
ncbi:MAG: ADP-ribosylation factor-like protein [Candidatus Hodarchaeota archaeon]